MTHIQSRQSTLQIRSKLKTHALAKPNYSAIRQRNGRPRSRLQIGLSLLLERPEVMARQTGRFKLFNSLFDRITNRGLLNQGGAEFACIQLSKGNFLLRNFFSKLANANRSRICGKWRYLVSVRRTLSSFRPIVQRNPHQSAVSH